jgi:hypothetical protein
LGFATSVSVDAGDGGENAVVNAFVNFVNIEFVSLDSPFGPEGAFESDGLFDPEGALEPDGAVEAKPSFILLRIPPAINNIKAIKHILRIKKRIFIILYIFIFYKN